MALNSQHPFYTEFHEDWNTMRDLYRGERVVKRRQDHYLPPTSGMLADGMGVDASGKPKPGQAAYNAYLMRAHFQDLVKEGVEALIGMMHQKPAIFELPDQMQPLLEKCTLTGEGLQELLRKINTEQLTTGRVGLLADLPAQIPTAKPGDPPIAVLPYIATYFAESIINWDDSNMEQGYIALNMVVLNESGFVRFDDDGFTWKEVQKYRVLQLGDIVKDENAGQAMYKMGVFSNRNMQNTDANSAVAASSAIQNNLAYDSSVMASPMFMGRTLDEIPFVFINTKDIVVTPDEPPLLGLGRLNLTIYRADADYRQTLFMTSQDTLVVTGSVKKSDGSTNEEPLRVGAGAVIYVEQGGDAKYVGVESEGLSEQRQSLQNDLALAASKAGRLVQPGPSKQDESGEALKVRITAQTATLNQIANTGAKGLENLLKTIGRWIGLTSDVVDTIKVTPNLEFADFALVAQDIVQLMTARSMGAPLSKKSIHSVMVERGITQMTFDDEMAEIEEEGPMVPPVAPANQGGPNPDELDGDEPAPNKNNDQTT